MIAKYFLSIYSDKYLQSHFHKIKLKIKKTENLKHILKVFMIRNPCYGIIRINMMKTLFTDFVHMIQFPLSEAKQNSNTII